MASLLQWFTLSLVTGTLAVSCVYDFIPTGIENDVNIIVIEGDIIAGDHSYFRISNTVPLSSTTPVKYITQATVWVESESGEIISAAYDSNTAGTFVANTMGLDLNKKYKLCVDVAKRGSYQSIYMPVLQTPQIDSITYSIGDNRSSVQLQVTTHNDHSDQKHYKWTYHEDWEFKVAYIPYIRYNLEKDIAETIPVEEIGVNYYCWERDSSTGIFIASTEKLSKNLVYKQPLNTIYSADRRVSYIYSILVSQISLSPQAYIYWETLKKNTEETGGIFAPQPSEMRGNLESITRPGEPVLGYISASTQTTKRIFLYDEKIRVYKASTACPSDTLLHYEGGANLWKNAAENGAYEILDYVDGNPRIGVWVSAQCTNCVKAGGSKRKPIFWPNNH